MKRPTALAPALAASLARASLALTFALAFALAFALQGCGDKQQAQGKNVVVFWQFFPAEQINPVLEEFRKQNPDVTVQMEQLTWQSGLEKITASVAAGTVPDLCELGSTWFPRFAAQGALDDWTDSTAALQSDMILAEMTRVNGRSYGLPWAVGTRALFWNKALFAQAGIDTTHPPDTWNDLLQAATKIKASGVPGYGVNAGERYVLFKKFMPYAWSNGGQVLTPDGKASAFDSRENVEALLFYLALANVGRVDRQDQLDEAFMQGKLGAEISGAWLFKKIPKQAADLHYGVALVPRPGKPDGRHASFAGGEILCTFKASKNKPAALRLARYLASREAAMMLAKANQGVQPAARGAESDAYYQARPNERVLLEQLALAVPTPNHPAWLDMEAAIEDEVERALYKKATAGQAIAAASARIDALAKGATANGAPAK